MAATGRPSTYSAEIADEICERLINGESLRAICKDDHMPHAGTVCRWLANESYAQFREQYARARELQADALFDESLEIADDGTNDWMRNKYPDNEGYKLNGEHVQRSRLRVDTRKWMAAKLAPKKYGDKLELEHSGNAMVVPTIPTQDEWEAEHARGH